MSRDYSYLKNTITDWNLSLDDNQIKQLDLFYEMLVEKNKVMNLTGITEFDEVIVKHFADSLSIGKVMPNGIQSVCDLGTGAGFPGIPMAIAYPDIQFTLIDSLNKRIKFLQEVVDALGLNNLAKNYSTIYPIASRCGVFAKSDIQPLINDGARKEDIAASVFQSVVNQTISGLACGKPIKGHIAFLGGPLYFLSELGTVLHSY